MHFVHLHRNGSAFVSLCWAAIFIEVVNIIFGRLPLSDRVHCMFVFVPCETSAIINGNKNRSMILNCFRDCIIFNSGLVWFGSVELSWVELSRTHTSFAFKFLVYLKHVRQRALLLVTVVSVLFACLLASPICFDVMGLYACLFHSNAACSNCGSVWHVVFSLISLFEQLFI